MAIADWVRRHVTSLDGKYPHGYPCLPLRRGRSPIALRAAFPPPVSLQNLVIFKRFAWLALAFLAGLALSRALLVWQHADRVLATEGLGQVFAQGLRFDLILLGLLFVLPVTLLPWFHLSRIGRRMAAWLFPAWCAAVVAGVVFVEAASGPFIDQFDARPNWLFVEYLRYPREVLATIWGLHPVRLIVVTLACLAAAGAAFRWMRRDPERDRPSSGWFCLWVTPVLLLVFVAMIRSTLDHRPVNPSVAAFSSDTMVNSLPLNSPYSVLYAIYEHRRDREATQFRYGVIGDAAVVRVMQAEAGIAPDDLLDPAVPTLHHQDATTPRERPLNLLMVVMESIGAEHVAALGGRTLTPEIDALADQGLWFERLYATGMRSARGLEALVSGFTPSTAEAAVKAPQAQDDFFTIAEFLRRKGYATHFLYGGESHFDNMRRFFLNNGFQGVTDDDDFENPVFRGPWGVSDEDLFDRALAHLEAADAADAPFFSLVFTSSNHEPFDVPPGRVTPEEDTPGTGEPPGRATAIKYSDWALGRFLEQARKASWWEDTVVLVVADHNARTWGGHLVPVDRFRVPGVVLGADIEPRRVPGIVSQIDLVPTLLSLLGVSGAHPAIGRDLTRAEFREGSGRAVMQFHGLQAFVEGDRAVILQADHEPRAFHLLPSGEFEPLPAEDRKLVYKALAYARFGPWLFENRAYRLPE